MSAGTVDGEQAVTLQAHPLDSLLDYLAEQIAKELISEYQNKQLERINEDAN